MIDRVREKRLRRMARRMGWKLQKSRARIWSGNDHGWFMLMNDRDYVVAGERFDADLDRIERELQNEQQRIHAL